MQAFILVSTESKTVPGTRYIFNKYLLTEKYFQIELKNTVMLISELKQMIGKGICLCARQAESCRISDQRQNTMHKDHCCHLHSTYYMVGIVLRAFTYTYLFTLHHSSVRYHCYYPHFMDEGTELAHSPISTDQSWDLNPHGLTPEPREGEAGGGSIIYPTFISIVLNTF